MKCLQVIRPGDLRSKDPEKKGLMEVQELPEPQITSPTEVKIKVAYCAICASDPHVAQNIFGRKVPYGMGHEISGVIVEMGEGVNTKGLKVGDRVAGNFLRACGRCYHCQNGHPEFCTNAIDEGSAPGYAEYVVWDESQVWKIPDDMPLRKACLLEPTSIAVRVADRTDIKLGERVCIQGGGPIGQLCLQTLKMRGATDLTVIEPREDRREFAKKFGADHVIDPTKCDVVEECKKLTNGLGYDVVIEITGVPAIADIPLKIAADGGTIMYIAMYDDGYAMQVPMTDTFHNRNLTLRATKVAPYCFPRAVQILSRMELDDFMPISFPLTEINKAFETFFTGKYLKVLINCNEDLKDA
jgi:(R,R)-butanediol dehydrogenase/meso-butanediol dehydrogenase/diacetyl reductase/L-iditol 2-dehydrogenase